MLRIYSDAIALVRLLRPVVDVLSRKSRNLEDQLTRALDSVTLNIAEGSRAQGKKRNSHYFIAMASAEEARAALDQANAWGHIPQISFEVSETFKRIIGTLYNVIH